MVKKKMQNNYIYNTISTFIGISFSGFPQRLENMENENGYGKVMEKSWNKTIGKEEFCDQS